MSADLFAEFGQGSSSAQSSGTRPQPTQSQADSLISGLETSDDFFGAASSNLQSHQNLSNPWTLSNYHYATQVPQQQAFGFQTFDLPRQQDSDVLFDATVDTPASEEEDDWGEFEGPQGTSQQTQPPQTEPVIPQAQVSASQPRPAAQVTGATSSFDLLSLDETPPAPIQSSGKSQGSAQQASNALLQPTKEDDSFDDWGEFTSGQLPTTTSVETAPNKAQQPVKPATPQPKWEDESFDDWGEFTDGQPPATTPAEAAKPAPKKAQSLVKPAPPQPALEDDSFEAWDDFTDGPSTSPTSAPSKPRPKPTPNPTTPASTSTTTPPTRNFISPTTSSQPTVRPTNIPPPSVLLDLLVTLLNNLQKEALKGKRQTSPSTATTTTTIASTIHNTLTTASHIIAGRTFRWKRDNILSQAMRIGPARSGKPGGMKLSAVNKHEDVKEEQDAVDVVGLWRERAALFNSVLQGAGLKAIPAVPDPGALKVVTAKPEQGALKAGHACALCALRREERVLRVDEGVEDSFGEWWTEHWGHTGCRVFWERNSGLLGQR